MLPPLLPPLALVWLPCFTFRVALPYRISTVLYCFNERDDVLLLKRAQEPNRGLWSPCGGKLQTGKGESPYACACREAREETGLRLRPTELHLTGLISEHGYQGQAHWLMFLFEVGPRLRKLPARHREGDFQFFSSSAVAALELPQTDRERIWPLFWQHRGGFFAAHCHCRADGRNEWTLEESRVLSPESRVLRRRARAGNSTSGTARSDGVPPAQDSRFETQD